MIKHFAHKGLEQFFLTGIKARIQAAHATKLQLTFKFDGQDFEVVNYQDYH